MLEKSEWTGNVSKDCGVAPNTNIYLPFDPLHLQFGRPDLQKHSQRLHFLHLALHLPYPHEILHLCLLAAKGIAQVG